MKIQNAKKGFKVLLCSVACASLLAACGKSGGGGVSAAGSDSSASSSPSVPSNSMSQKTMKDIQQTLVNQSSLSEAQILAILAGGQNALNIAGLLNSNDINALLPVLLQGLVQGVGNLNLGSNSQISNLLSLIGGGTLSSLIGSIGQGTLSGLPADLVTNITNALLKNIPLAGVTSGNLSSVVNQLMSSLISQIGVINQNGKFSLPDLSALLKNLLSGAMTGVGNIPGFDFSKINTILQQIASGSVAGLLGLPLSGGLNLTNLQTLLSAITTGAQAGLQKLINSNNGLGLNLQDLLGQILQGQFSGIQLLPVTSNLQQTLISFLLSWLVNLGV